MVVVIDTEVADQIVEILLPEDYKFQEAFQLDCLKDSFTSCVHVPWDLRQSVRSHRFATNSLGNLGPGRASRFPPSCPAGILRPVSTDHNTRDLRLSNRSSRPGKSKSSGFPRFCQHQQRTRKHFQSPEPGGRVRSSFLSQDTNLLSPTTFCS